MSRGPRINRDPEAILADYYEWSAERNRWMDKYRPGVRVRCAFDEERVGTIHTARRNGDVWNNVDVMVEWDDHSWWQTQDTYLVIIPTEEEQPSGDA